MSKDIEELGGKEEASDSVTKSSKKGTPPKELPAISEIDKPEKEKKKDVPSVPLTGGSASSSQDGPADEESIKVSEEKISPPEEPTEPKEKKFSYKKILIPVVIIAIILLAGGGIYYWFNYLRAPEPVAGPEEEPEFKIPSPFIQVDSTKVIEIQSGEEDVLLGKLREELFQAQEVGTLKQTLVKHISGDDAVVMSFCDLIENLAVAMPFNCLNAFDEASEYIFLLYSQEEGIRPGLVAKISDVEILNNSTEEWEATMESDLRPIFLGYEVGAVTSEEFQTGMYKETNIRYLNFIDPSFAIDYAIVNDYFVVATSKDSMFEIMDRILGE